MEECHVMDEGDSGLSRACSRAKRWRRCAPSLGSPARPATKIFDRYKGTVAWRRSPTAVGGRRQANRLAPQIEAIIVRLKRGNYPGWARRRSARSCAAR